MQQIVRVGLPSAQPVGVQHRTYRQGCAAGLGVDRRGQAVVSPPALLARGARQGQPLPVCTARGIAMHFASQHTFAALGWCAQSLHRSSTSVRIHARMFAWWGLLEWAYCPPRLGLQLPPCFQAWVPIPGLASPHLSGPMRIRGACVAAC